MIETVILNYLNEKLDVPVLMELPPELPDGLVIIERIGSSRENHVTKDSIAFQSYSLTSLYNAASLDEEVRSAMDEIVELNEIGGIRLASNYNHTDPETKRYRYQCIYEIYHV